MNGQTNKWATLRESLSQWKNTRKYNEQTEDEAKFYSGGSVTAIIVVTAHHTS